MIAEYTLTCVLKMKYKLTAKLSLYMTTTAERGQQVVASQKSNVKHNY